VKLPLLIPCNNQACGSTHNDLVKDQIHEDEENKIPYFEKKQSGHPSRRHGFHANFLNLKTYLGMKTNVRKTQIDSVLKKSKSKFFKSIHQVLKKCIRCKIERLPQNFITNIKIDCNKNYLSKSILQMYQAHGALKNLESLIEQNLVRPENKTLLKEFLNLTFKEAFELYTKSEQYLRDYQNIRDKEDDNFAILFDYSSKIFIDYFAVSKGNKQKMLTKDGHRKNKLKTQPTE
jgi:hypothetical protein